MIDSNLESKIFNQIVYPALDELSKGRNQYVGILGIDIILDRNGNLNVIEFNSFLKEPDAQCVFDLLDDDIARIMNATVVGSLVDDYREIASKPLFSTSIVLSSGSYPSEGSYGDVITGLEEAQEHCEIAYFNTIKDANGNMLTSGGRTLVLTTEASTLEKSAQKLYECVELVGFDSMKYRKDIGKTVIIGC